MDLITFYTTAYSTYKETKITGRYLTQLDIEPILKKYEAAFKISHIGNSVLQKPIHTIYIGNGKKRILMWSQMHGNESTTTKAVLDLLCFIQNNEAFRTYIINNFTLCIIPMLNPDGAAAYTRVNSNEVDLNRDAQNLSQPESRLLRNVFNEFEPHFCFNLHDQRTIFSAGKSRHPATVSFLTPAEDKERKVTANRRKSMEVIAAIDKILQKFIPKQVGRYDDGFNLNCVGDTFQSMGVPTILFESGHFPDDYEREETRKYIAYALVAAINYIGETEITGKKYHGYFEIPENDKLFYDVILRKFPVKTKNGIEYKDIAVFFKETLLNDKIEFIPSVEHIEPHLHFYGHKELTMSKIEVAPVEIDRLNNSYLTEFLKKI
ncbi:M14 family metallopeptidase [Galbibacter pacificus]|uniref:M14 family metallopeptidase n=1 Tax=Galbibacter pacificus TaxID=2996052 RepID=A0ABT6FQ85_9FLAO|nr:M14 metallopeptidase family protein [Galbibacter pacificus]MDG3582099.1 M14 family metallopeptidase [Galbibacter pacificus]MDG3585425.1 M14 family metallopeptidase [Galbibacter pacificus]